MRRTRISSALAYLILAGLACNLPAGVVPIDTPVPPPNTASTVAPSPLPDSPCGDGICQGPENPNLCPADCGASDIPAPDASSTLPSTITPAPEPTSETESPVAAVPPMYFFYAIHTHAGSDWAPYDGPPQVSIDADTADNMLLAIEGIRDVLDRYEVRGTWEVVGGTASGLCAYQGDNHIFEQLQTDGHEVAVHAHRTEQIEAAYQALRDDCGVEASTTSGFILDADRAGLAGAQGAISTAIRTSLAQGLTVGTENLSPGGQKNPFAALCNNAIGPGNDMWTRTGNLMFPWRPDYNGENICADAPDGELVMVDHVSGEWMLLADGAMPAVLTTAHFDALRGLFDGALQYMQAQRPERVAAWGFVTHITEYAVGNDASAPPDPAALAALDGFLAYVDTQRIAGRVVYATAAEIAAAAYP